MEDLFWIGFVGAAIALLFAWLQRSRVMSFSEGNEKMRKIAASIREGANAYLKHQYTTVAKVFLVVFLVLLVMAFATGSSWGTFAICMPIALPLAFSMSGGEVTQLVVAVFAAVAGGGVFGDHCSPLSDTTILSSMGSASDHLDHVRTQLPYALTCGALAAAAYLVLGFVIG